MTLAARTLVIVVILLAFGPAPLSALQGQPPQQQSEFIPIDQLPPQDQLPAAPLLIGAYSFVVIALSGYLLTVARRLNAVQREVERLERDMKHIERA